MSYIFHPVGRPTETPRPEDAALPSYYFRSRLSSKKCTNFRENYNIVFYFRSCTIYSNNIYARTPKIKGNYPRSSSLPERARRCSSSSLRSCSHFNTRPRPKSSRLSMRIGCSSRGCPLGVSVVLGHALSSCSSCSGTLRISCASRGCSLGVFGVFIDENKLPFSDMGVRDPLLTETPQSVLASLWYFAGTPNSGTPPPLGIEFTSPKMRDLLLNFTKFW